MRLLLDIHTGVDHGSFIIFAYVLCCILGYTERRLLRFSANSAFPSRLERGGQKKICLCLLMVMGNEGTKRTKKDHIERRFLLFTTKGDTTVFYFVQRFLVAWANIYWAGCCF